MFDLAKQKMLVWAELVMIHINKSISCIIKTYHKGPIWFVISIVVGISIGTVFFAPIGEVFKGVASLPAIGGLLTALFQVVRDDAAHKRAIEMQNNQNLFNLGATSHMANTVFDKHVEFSEKYLAEVHNLVETLTREGPTQSALVHSSKLNKLRIDYTAWITPEIEEKLEPFEKAIRIIGAKAGYVEAIRGQKEDSKIRSKAIEEMFDTFSNLMDIETSDSKDAEATVKGVKSRLREVLKIVELVSIRDYLVSQAANSAENG